MQHFTLNQKSRTKNRKERRRRERQWREEEYRRRIERLRRQIEEARKRRQRLLLVLLLALLAALESMRPWRTWVMYWPEPNSVDWTPDPANDFAAAPDSDDYCDGYSREQWDRMAEERGIKLSRKAELKDAWKADPERELFAERYKDWSYRPYLGEIMNDLTDQRYQLDALAALKVLSPPEVHRYLDEVYAINPASLLHCRADLSADIVRNFQRGAVVWEEDKRRREADAKRDRELSRKNDDDLGIPEPK